jgi:ribonuclease-3
VSSSAENLENKIGVIFTNKNLLKEALTHRSYINENPDWDVPHNERLEFLGDAVLELAVTEKLYADYPKLAEGDLTSIRAALVNYQTLSKIAKEINLDGAIYLSKGGAKETDRAKDVIMANAFESLIGAIYLDKGYSIAADFIVKNVLKMVKEIMDKKLYKDPKSLLQEIIQEKLKVTPMYEVIKEEGPDHNKVFEVGVYFDGVLSGTGKGFSKQEAEVEAAKDALQKINS